MQAFVRLITAVGLPLRKTAEEFWEQWREHIQFTLSSVDCVISVGMMGICCMKFHDFTAPSVYLVTVS
jgi:ABC-type proline/glycine betaine transport system permease subunit